MVELVGLTGDDFEGAGTRKSLIDIARKLSTNLEILQPLPSSFLLGLRTISPSLTYVRGPPINTIFVRDPVLLPYMFDLATEYEKEGYGTFTLQREYQE